MLGGAVDEVGAAGVVERGVPDVDVVGAVDTSDRSCSIDVVVEAGETPAQPTTVVDWSEGAPEVIRRGGGDPGRFAA